MAIFKGVGLSAFVIIVFLLMTSVFTVHEGERGLLLRLGKLSRDSDGKVIVYQPGIHFKYPFINTVRLFDVRLQTMTANQYKVFTEGQKRLLVDYYVKWRIKDLGNYYQRVGGYASSAEALLEKRLNNALRSSVGKMKLLDFISYDRVNVMAALSAAADTTAKDIGIEVVDVRIKQADLPPEVAPAVYDRMISDRRQDAATFRAEGNAKARKIKADAEALVQIRFANAEKTAAEVRAEGSKEAAQIYGDTYKKDSEFYDFYRSLQAYRNTFSGQSDLIVLQPNGDFFKYFRHMMAGQTSAKHAKPAA